MRVQIIYNPRSGCGQAERAALAAAQVWTAAGWEVALTPTARAGDATLLAARLATEADLIVACGGDGTLSEVINGLLGADTPVGLIPAGTGNDFGRTVGLSRDPRQAARQLLNGAAQPIDLLMVGGDNRVAINVLGVGFDAAVAKRMNTQTRSTGGARAYLSAVVLELAHLRPTRVHLRVDDREWEGEALLVAVANAQSYGAGMRIAPAASISDGLLDVVLVRHMPRLRFLRCLPRVFRGTHTALPEVEIWQGREVRIETDEPRPVLVDGDLQGETPLAVRVLPGALRMWLPRA